MQTESEKQVKLTKHSPHHDVSTLGGDKFRLSSPARCLYCSELYLFAAPGGCVLCLEVRRILLIAHPQSLKRQQYVAMAPLGLSRRKENLKNSRGMLRRRNVSQPREETTGRCGVQKPQWLMSVQLAGGICREVGVRLCMWQWATWEGGTHTYTHTRSSAVSCADLNACAPSERVQCARCTPQMCVGGLSGSTGRLKMLEPWSE